MVLINRETLLEILKEHKQDYEFPNNYWEGVLLEALTEVIEIISKLGE